jgi:hypothetical protein
MTAYPPTPDHDRLSGEPGPTWLDEEHIIEPLDPADARKVPPNDPIMVDVTGRMWRLRYRPPWTGVLTRVAPVLLGVVLLLLLMLRV